MAMTEAGGPLGGWARSVWSKAPVRRVIAATIALSFAAIIFIFYARPVFALLVLAFWTFLLVRLICVPAAVSLLTLTIYLLLGTLGGVIVLPFIPSLVAPYAAYDLLPRHWPVLAVLVEALKVATVLAPVAYLLLKPHASTSLSPVDAFLLAFMTGLGAELITYLLIAGGAPPAQVPVLSWVPPWQAIRGARVVAGYAYWAGLTAMALAAALRFFRSSRAAIAVPAIVFVYAVADAAFAGGSFHRFTFEGRLTAWLTLVGAVVFSILEARSRRGSEIAAVENRPRATWASLASVLRWRKAGEPARVMDAVSPGRLLHYIRAFGEVALWLLLAFAIFVLPRLGQSVQVSLWTPVLFRLGPPFIPTVINAALMLILLNRYVLVAGGQATSTDKDDSVAAFGSQLAAKAGLGAVAIVLFGLDLVDEYPYQLVTQSFNQFRMQTVLLLLAVAVTGTTSSLAPQEQEGAARRWRLALVREGRRLAPLAWGLVAVWLGLAFYRITANLMTSIVGYERIYPATMLAALGTAGFSFGMSYAARFLLPRESHLLSGVRRLMQRYPVKGGGRRPPADG